MLLLVSAVVAASVLSSLPPPAKALAKIGGASARVGPGPVAEVVTKNGYRVELHVSPNRAAAENTFALRITRGGQPVTGAEVVVGATMLDMEMGTQSYALTEMFPGFYSDAAPALVMVGHWGLSFEVTEERPALYRSARGSGQRMSERNVNVVLTAALLALLAGAAACIVVALLAVDVLG